ncbi:MAG: glycosyltransferase, partial [Ilumatobacteraceae bacterium]
VIVDHFGTDPSTIVVVPHGVEPHLGQNAPTESHLRRQYGLGDGPVIVFPAITHPHKGHRFLLEVMAAHWSDPDLRLVLLGGAGLAAAEVDRAIVELGLEPRVVRPGRVPAGDRDGLIALADALVFPSEYEGFGAPVVEAMALGTPVVCSDQAALAEVVGDACIVLPRTVDAWAGALDEVARRRPALVTAGRARAADFTIARSGAALAVAYRTALEHGR